MHSRATQQCNTSPYVYAVYWLQTASSAFLLAREYNSLAERMLITCVMQMRGSDTQTLMECPYCTFPILWLYHGFINESPNWEGPVHGSLSPVPFVWGPRGVI